MNEIIRPTDELPVSVLKANHIVFDELSFVRDGFSLKDDSKTSFNLSYGIDKISDGEYRTTLTAQATREGEFKAKVQISGYWSIEESGLSQKSVASGKCFWLFISVCSFANDSFNSAT